MLVCLISWKNMFALSLFFQVQSWLVKTWQVFLLTSGDSSDFIPGTTFSSWRWATSFLYNHNASQLDHRCVPISLTKLPSGNLTYLWKITIYSDISHEKWWFSIAMLVYQRVTAGWYLGCLFATWSHPLTSGLGRCTRLNQRRSITCSCSFCQLPGESRTQWAIFHWIPKLC